MKILPIGTVLRLKKGEHKLMIISRTPLTNNGGTIGYYDYGACLYPEGMIETTTHFFNSEDTEEIFSDGYIDDDEIRIQETFEEKLSKVTYPRFTTGD